MKEMRNLHLKVQELCDCFASTDLLREMSVVKDDSEIDEAALKWIALAVLHGVNADAEKITISRSKEGEVKVKAAYRKATLPPPGPEVGDRIIQSVREITHISEDKGKLPLSLGIRGNSLDLKIKVKAKKGSESVTIKFP